MVSCCLSYPYKNGHLFALKPDVHWKGDTEVNFGRVVISKPLPTLSSIQSPSLGGYGDLGPSNCRVVFSLDSKPQISTWQRKVKRIYSCAISGLSRCES